jgi:uncharacterized membrane protein YtjA (UPF0391 family)
MPRWPIAFLIAALAAAALGFSGALEDASDLAFIAFFVFGAFYVLSFFASPARSVTGSALGALGGLALVGVVAVLVVWLSDDYSLEASGAKLEATLADARTELSRIAEDPGAAARDAREGVAETFEEARDAVAPTAHAPRRAEPADPKRNPTSFEESF